MRRRILLYLNYKMQCLISYKLFYDIEPNWFINRTGTIQATAETTGALLRTIFTRRTTMQCLILQTIPMGAIHAQVRNMPLVFEVERVNFSRDHFGRL